MLKAELREKVKEVREATCQWTWENLQLWAGAFPSPPGRGFRLDSLIDFLPSNSQAGKEMIGFDTWVEEKGLHRRGESVRRKLLKQERPQPYRRTVVNPSILGPFMDFLVKQASEVGYNGQRLLLERKDLGLKKATTR
jgi:hypothetical protein